MIVSAYKKRHIERGLDKRIIVIYNHILCMHVEAFTGKYIPIVGIVFRYISDQ